MKIRATETYTPENTLDCDKLREKNLCGNCVWERTINNKDPSYHKKYGCFHRVTMLEHCDILDDDTLSWAKYNIRGVM